MIASDYNNFLFRTFPELTGRIPHLPLLNTPTPLEQMKSLGERLGIKNLWVKRDDLTAHPYGGNKPRKLEFIIADALSKGADAILTFGGIGTNHGLATTIYGAKNNLRSLLVLYPQPVTEHVHQNILLMRHFGAEMRLAGSYPGAALTAYQWIRQERRSGRKVYLLPPGGSSVVGALGYISAALELAAQVNEGVVPCPDYIFVPAGTCGTIAGLLAGLHLAGLPTKVVAVRVTMKLAANHIVAFKLCRNAIAFLKKNGAKIPAQGVSSEKLIFLHTYYGGEYGRATPQGLDAINLIKSNEGLSLEPTYTGKTAAGMIDFIHKRSKPDEVYLFWNTFNSQDLTLYLRDTSVDSLPASFQRYFI
ncbi:MAG: pyridoxal-phosphate dependent enzyme [bacterium]